MLSGLRLILNRGPEIQRTHLLYDFSSHLIKHTGLGLISAHYTAVHGHTFEVVELEAHDITGAVALAQFVP